MNKFPLKDRLLRYLGVGALATFVHHLLFAGLLLVWAPWTASVAGAATGALVSFWGNRRACFPASAGRKLQPLRFILVSLLHNLGNAAVMWLLLECLSWGPLLAQALTTLCLTLLGFLAHRYWTYADVDIFTCYRTTRSR
ncbi:GtrA family protein [Pseudomonas rubra]|uniref:GtrA family protein n=1 Tax=Pseudomonas rubra TaxID=2942627 RepID=A0ABT5P5L1_9PSED|nr:GtrA family protein [Pseudomonas rubra]MDD1013447.1 GtrA family protein [Pseudomonas rubra]MDD1040434.1 GtrA family protein [Pseudomonas rubra]MDD1155039.1 GtrA family protein [Pseudomonas rubra]